MIKQPILLVLAWVGMLAAAYFGITTALFLQRAESSFGYVTNISSYESRCGGGRRSRSYPCTKFQADIRFTSASSKVVTSRISAGSCRSYCSSCGADYGMGQSVPILYDPNHPETFRLNTTFGKWGTTFGSLGVTLILFICSFFEPSQRRRRWSAW